MSRTKRGNDSECEQGCDDDDDEDDEDDEDEIDDEDEELGSNNGGEFNEYDNESEEIMINYSNSIGGERVSDKSSNLIKKDLSQTGKPLIIWFETIQLLLLFYFKSLVI